MINSDMRQVSSHWGKPLEKLNSVPLENISAKAKTHWSSEQRNNKDFLGSKPQKPELHKQNCRIPQ